MCRVQCYMYNRSTYISVALQHVTHMCTGIDALLLHRMLDFGVSAKAMHCLRSSTAIILFVVVDPAHSPTVATHIRSVSKNGQG